VKRFQDETIERARRDGYVETLAGRRRTLRDIDSKNGMIRSAAERTAINTPIQGTAADMIKLAMIHVEAALRKAKLQARMLLQVHDELLFEMPASEVEQAREIIVDAMKHALKLPGVEAEVEAGTGANWLEAH